MMLVDTGFPYVFLTPKTWNSIGVKVEDLPNAQASIGKDQWRQSPRAYLLEAFQRHRCLGSFFSKESQDGSRLSVQDVVELEKLFA